MTALPLPGTTASATGAHMHYGNSSHLNTTSMQASFVASQRSTSASLASPSFSIGPTVGNSKRKRRPAGTPDPDAEVVALSPKTLMESDRYVCEICSQGFQRDQNLQMHRRKHKVPWKLLKRSSSEVRKRVYVCPDPSCLHHDPCHALGDLVGIKKHYRRKHSCDKQWKCEKCSKGYAVQSDYKAHLKTCGTRGHCCDCGRVFSRVESFIEHQDTCSAAREKTAVASSDQTSLASLSARDDSASPSADTVSVNNRSVGGVVRSLDSTTRYESTTWLMDHRELQLLPAKQYIEFSQSSGLVYPVDREGKDNFGVKEPEAAFVSQSRYITGSPTLVNSSSAAISNDEEAAPPRLQLSIGLYYESSHETAGIERKEGLRKNDAATEPLVPRSAVTPPSLTSDASVKSGSGRSSTTTNNEVINQRFNFLHAHPTGNETPDLKGQLSRNAENPTALELETNPGAVCGTTEKSMFVVQAHAQESPAVEDRQPWTSPKKVARFEGATTAARSEAVVTFNNEMRSESWKELSRSQAEESTSGSAAATRSRMRSEAPRGRHAEVEHEWVGERSREAEDVRRQAREQLRLLTAYADEAREAAKTQMELAQADLRNASRIREHAEAQLFNAYLFQQQATRRIDSSRLQITCQACRQKFHLQVAAQEEAAAESNRLRATPFQPTIDSWTDAS